MIALDGPWLPLTAADELRQLGPMISLDGPWLPLTAADELRQPHAPGELECGRAVHLGERDVHIHRDRQGGEAQDRRAQDRAREAQGSSTRAH